MTWKNQKGNLKINMSLKKGNHFKRKGFSSNRHFSGPPSWLSCSFSIPFQARSKTQWLDPWFELGSLRLKTREVSFSDGECFRKGFLLKHSRNLFMFWYLMLVFGGSPNKRWTSFLGWWDDYVPRLVDRNDLSWLLSQHEESLWLYELWVIRFLGSKSWGTSIPENFRFVS